MFNPHFAPFAVDSGPVYGSGALFESVIAWNV